MDRSRLSAAIPGIVFGAGTDGPADVVVVVVDLAKDAARVGELRASFASARIVCYGPHVDAAGAAAARAAGADVVLARSRFFHDPATAITAPPS
jgi:hypothetical protein